MTSRGECDEPAVIVAPLRDDDGVTALAILAASSWGDPAVVVALILALFTAALVVGTFRMAKSTRRAAEAAQAAAERAADALDFERAREDRILRETTERQGRAVSVVMEFGSEGEAVTFHVENYSSMSVSWLEYWGVLDNGLHVQLEGSPTPLFVAGAENRTTLHAGTSGHRLVSAHIEFTDNDGRRWRRDHLNKLSLLDGVDLG